MDLVTIYDCFQILLAVISSVVTAVVHIQTLKRELPRLKNFARPAMEKKVHEVERPAQNSNRFACHFYFSIQ